MQEFRINKLNLTLNTDKKELRKFGFIIGIGMALMFGLMIPLIFSKPFHIWPWITFAVFSFFALTLPTCLKPIYVAWMTVGHIIGNINARIILIIIFYLLITPIGLLVKIFQGDPLEKKIDPTLKSYRIFSENESYKERMERPF